MNVVGFARLIVKKSTGVLAGKNPNSAFCWDSKKETQRVLGSKGQDPKKAN